MRTATVKGCSKSFGERCVIQSLQGGVLSPNDFEQLPSSGGRDAALPTQVFEQVPVEIQKAVEKKIERDENREQKPESETDGMGPGFVFQATDYQHFRKPYRSGWHNAGYKQRQ